MGALTVKPIQLYTTDPRLAKNLQAFSVRYKVTFLHADMDEAMRALLNFGASRLCFGFDPKHLEDPKSDLHFAAHEDWRAENASSGYTYSPPTLYLPTRMYTRLEALRVCLNQQALSRSIGDLARVLIGWAEGACARRNMTAYEIQNDPRVAAHIFVCHAQGDLSAGEALIENVTFDYASALKPQSL